jgi:hypothetical protein
MSISATTNNFLTSSPSNSMPTTRRQKKKKASSYGYGYHHTRWTIPSAVRQWQDTLPVMGQGSAQTRLNDMGDLGAIWALMALSGWKDYLYVEYEEKT